MKKVLFVGLVFGALALTSCKKDYTCTIKMPGMADTVVAYNDLKKADADKAETTCKAASGTWASK